MSKRNAVKAAAVVPMGYTVEATSAIAKQVKRPFTYTRTYYRAIKEHYDEQDALKKERQS